MDSQSIKSASQFSDIIQVQPVVVKAHFQQLKFKFSIKDEDFSFKSLKAEILEKINKKLSSNIEMEDIELQDDTSFDYEEDDQIRDHAENFQLSVKVVVKQQLQQQQDQVKVQQSYQNENHQPIQQQQNQNHQNEQGQKINDDALQQLKKDQEQYQKNVQKEDPTEAIVVLYDVSGSMRCKFYTEDHLNRIGATNAFFSAFADKTLAFEFNHIVSLYCFDSKIEKLCDFIPDLDKFINLVDGVQSGGATRLYDTVHMAIQDLIEIKKKYPNIICRILALTDGEDNQSTYQPLSLAKEIVKNNIIMDSFVVSENCKGLKNMTHCSGGRCYQPKDINQGLKLFEIETIISAKSRGMDNLFDQEKAKNYESLDLSQYDSQPFDTEGVEMEKPKQMQSQGMSAEEIIKKVMEVQKKQEQQKQHDSQSVGQSSKNAGGGALKRIHKELQDITNNKEELIRYFPTDDIYIWKVLLIGPKNTTYNKGVYTVLLQFPHDYPFKPPKVQFMTKIYHCNISQQGQLCLDILKSNWSPALTVNKLMLSILSLLENPNPDDSLDSTIASFYKDKDRQVEYKEKLLSETLKNADREAGVVLEEILGQGKESLEVKQVQELQQWMENARK